MARDAGIERTVDAAALARLASELRSAVAVALASNSSLASLLDSCRSDVERLTMLSDAASSDEIRSVVGRCRMVLGAWRAISPIPRQTTHAIDSSARRACRDCNAETVREVTGAGRRAPYRGVIVEIPAWFPIPTCAACGAEQLDEKLGRELDLALASAYASGQRG